MNQNMFLYRLKTEFSENRRWLVFYLLYLAIIFAGNLFWWFDSGISENDGPIYENSFVQLACWLVVLGLGFIALTLIGSTFERDDLKSPQDFCATRPIRPLPLYGAKLAFLWLAIALPISVTTATTSLITGCGAASIIAGVEMLIWIGFPSSFLAFCGMSQEGTIQSLKMAGSFIISALCTWVLLLAINSEGLLGGSPLGPAFSAYNILIFLALLTLAFTWMCILQARNKHLHHRPLWLSLTGAISILCITFVPVPNPLQPGTTRISAVTEARVTSRIGMSERGDKPYVEGQILSPPIKELYGQGLDPNSIDQDSIQITGIDAPWLEIYCEGYAHKKHCSLDKPMPIELDLRYKVYGTNLEAINSDTKTGITELYDAVKGLPKRKVRVKGSITINHLNYEELHRSPLSEGFTLSSGGIRMTHMPGNPDRSIHEHIITTKNFSPTSTASRHVYIGNTFRHYITHPTLNEPLSIDEFRQFSHGISNVYMHSMTKKYDFSANRIRSSDMWLEIKDEHGYEGSPADWRKEAILVTEKAGAPMRTEVPLNFEIEIPDPELIRKLLTEGEF